MAPDLAKISSMIIHIASWDNSLSLFSTTPSLYEPAAECLPYPLLHNANTDVRQRTEATATIRLTVSRGQAVMEYGAPVCVYQGIA